MPEFLKSPRVESPQAQPLRPPMGVRQIMCHQVGGTLLLVRSACKTKLTRHGKLTNGRSLPTRARRIEPFADDSTFTAAGQREERIPSGLRLRTISKRWFYHSPPIKMRKCFQLTAHRTTELAHTNYSTAAAVSRSLVTRRYNSEGIVFANPRSEQTSRQQPPGSHFNSHLRAPRT